MVENAPEHWRRVVAIETSGREGSIAILWDGERYEREIGSNRAHARNLLPELQETLKSIDLSNGSGALPLDGVIVGTGPGSYTGLRIGIATAQGLARGSEATLLGVPSFEAQAYQELLPGESAAIAMDARAGGFYFASYQREEVALVALREPCVLNAAELARELEEDRRVLAQVGLAQAAGLDGVTAEKLELAGPPTAGSILDLGLARVASGAAARYASSAPLYLRTFGRDTGG